MFLWPCIVSKAWGKKTNKMQQYRWFIVNCGCWLLTLSQHVLGIFMPETCWDSVNNQHPQLTINHLYCCILLVFFPHAVLMYGAETWVLSKADELRLWEKNTKKNLWIICEGVTWRSRYNKELYHLYDETDLITTIRITRLRWAGRIVWMQENYLGQAGGQKASGKVKPQMDGRRVEGCREDGS